MTYLTQSENKLGREPAGTNELLGYLFGKFIDTSLTASSRATFYNSKTEIEQVIQEIHEEFLKCDRSLYCLSLLLPSTNDFTKVTGIKQLLSRQNFEKGFINTTDEKKIITWLAQNLPPQRMLKLYTSLKDSRVNNSRIKGIILSTILESDKLELWSVKYRTRLRASLTHAWGKRLSGIITSILNKNLENWNIKEKNIININVDKYFTRKNEKIRVYQCIRFIFRIEENLMLPMHKAFADSKKSIEYGKLLPYEVLEGIRSTFHPTIKNERVLGMTKNKLTYSQKLLFQRKAGEVNLKIDFNPDNYDSVKLYLYAYEMGMTDEIRNALDKKASESAYFFNLGDKKTAILVDCSESMMGSETQKLRPMAVALALKDTLVKASKQSQILYCGGIVDDTSGLVTPSDSTSLASGFVELLLLKPDIIFILSDGYENRPAGRMDEVIKAAEKIGLNPKVIHYSPVMASEAFGVREISSRIKTLPFSSPESSATGLLKEAFSNDIEQARKILIRFIKPNLIKAKVDNKLLLGD